MQKDIEIAKYPKFEDTDRVIATTVEADTHSSRSYDTGKEQIKASPQNIQKIETDRNNSKLH